jgi:hypothetical protein
MRWQTYAAWMVEHGLIPADLDPLGAFTTELLPGSGSIPVAAPTP